MFSRHNRIIGLFYLLADAVLVLLSFWLAHWIRANLTTLRPLYPAAYYLGIVPVIVAIWIGGGVALGIYQDIREQELRRAFLDPLRVAFVSITILFAFTFAFGLQYISRVLLGLYAVLDLGAMVLLRLVARHFSEPLRRAAGGIRHFLVVGNTPEALLIARTIEANEKRGMRLLGFVAVSSAAHPNGEEMQRIYPTHNLADLPELLRRHVVDEIIVAVSKDDLPRLEETFLICEEEGIRTRVYLNFFPHRMSRVYLERLRNMPLLTFTTTPDNDLLLVLKRGLDFAMALTLFVLLSPLFLILALLIRLTSRGPVLYRQTRCGLGGRKFTVYKFRSMRPDADLLRDELRALNEMDGPVFKIRSDPRCTPIGRFMRRYSLDELPQLVNILKGDMSFVGPRPPLPEEVEKYERWQRRRLRMSPGLTCLWALEGRSNLSFRRWMELDLAYIDNWSFGLDWKILLKTVPAVLLGRGAS